STNSDVTLSPASLDFTTSNWSTAQTVTVSAAHDDDGVDDSATISLAGGRVTAASVSVSVADDDEDVGLILSTDELALDEGDSKTFTVRLIAQPGYPQAVSLSAPSGSDLTVTPTELNFTTSNWSTAQTVTVSAGQDADRANDTGTIRLSSEGIPEGLVSVTVIDDDDPTVGLTLSATSLTLNEGASATFTVRLAAQPGNPRTVTLSGASDSDVTITPAELSFSTSNWSAAQTVTLSAAHDENGEGEGETIRLTGAKITSGSVAVSVIDDDADVVLTLSQTVLNMSEGGSATFTVQLAAQPHSARTVNLSSTNADVTVTPASLNFSTSNWSAAQTVTVRAAQDEDGADDTATINLTGTRILANLARVSVADDEDPAVGLGLSRGSLDLIEGSSATFTVRLAAQPRNPRTVSLASSNTDVTITPATLNFSVNNWSVSQTVTLRAVQDADGNNETAAISLTGARITSGSVAVALVDDDPTVGLTLSTSELTVDEGGSATFTIRLSTPPSGARALTLASTSTEVTVTPASLSFSTSNWSTPQTVTVRAADDADGMDDTATINRTANTLTAALVNVTVIDDDDPAVGLYLSRGSLDLNEGTSETFRVWLAAQPRNPRTVNLTSDNADVTVTPATLDFSVNNWSTAQTVTLSGVQDADADDEIVTISLTGVRITSGQVGVDVLDDDIAVVPIMSPDGLSMDEGASATFTVQLYTQPRSAQTVTLASNNADVTVTPTTLNFTTSDWNTAQTVTVSVAQDDDGMDEAARISALVKSTASNFLDVRINDDDPPFRLSLSDTSLKLNEGSSGTFTARLTAQPESAQTVTLASTNSDVTFSPATLSFSTSNWNTVQTVTVTTAQDDDAVDDSATINLTGGAELNSAAVSVAVLENIKINRSRNYMIVKEGTSTASFY
ncbi:MAG: hypothetical protein ISN29_11430, partial [Gammaproteobacteria bacterium AqS3]|nr:hypothetical protein [Gammaproteobacteria bacterium AqS3]